MPDDLYWFYCAGGSFEHSLETADIEDLVELRPLLEGGWLHSSSFTKDFRLSLRCFIPNFFIGTAND